MAERVRPYYLTVQLGHLYLDGCAPQTSQVEDMVVCVSLRGAWNGELLFSGR